ITGGACFVDICRDSNDCNFITATCDPSSSRCAPTPATMGNSIGGTCSIDGDCKSGACQPQQAGPPVSWTGGYCTTGCTVLDDLTDTCPSNSICLTSTGHLGLLGFCFALCDTPAGGASRFGSCRIGYSCTAFTGDSRFGYCFTN